MEKIIEKLKQFFYWLLLQYKYLNQSFYIKKYLNEESKKILPPPSVKNVKSHWRQYTRLFDINFTRFYTAMNGEFSKYYIPDNLYYSYIDMHFNNSVFSPGVDIKAFYEIINPNLKMAKTTFRKLNGSCYSSDFKLIKELQIKDHFKADLEYIYKPAFDSQGGKGIKFLNSNDITPEFIDSNNNFIIQDVIEQHESLSKLHRSSLNTIRIITLFFKGQVYILSSVLRMGISGSRIDNASKGGIVVGIDESGRLKEIAYSSSDRKKYTEHPDSQIVFDGYQIEGFDSVVNIVSEQAKKFPFFRLISWDFAIDKTGEAVFVEFNLKNGQLDFHQFCNGPLFGELTDEVLSEVFLN